MQPFFLLKSNKPFNIQTELNNSIKFKQLSIQNHLIVHKTLSQSINNIKTIKTDTININKNKYLIKNNIIRRKNCLLQNFNNKRIIKNDYEPAKSLRRKFATLPSVNHFNLIIIFFINNFFFTAFN